MLTVACSDMPLIEPRRTRAIPFYNILWVALTGTELSVRYAKPSGKRDVTVAYLYYTLDLSPIGSTEKAEDWVARLLDRAYGKSQRKKRIKVLINPFGGAGKAAKWYPRDIEPIFTAAQCPVDVERTAYRGHAVEIARSIDIEAFDVIASCSGDGLPHEVFNGLAEKPNAREALRKVAVVQLPCGSGNAMSWSLNGTGSNSMAALAIVKGIRTRLDLASVTQGEKRTISFLSQAIGIAAESDLGTDNLRWMGSMRFTYGFLVRLLGKTVYPCDVALKTEIANKAAVKAHYRNTLSSNRQAAKLRSSDSASTLSHYRAGSQDRSSHLPELKYGTVTSPLPSDWSLIPYSNLGNLYSGNMAIMTEGAPFFPASLPFDGLVDLVTIDGDIGRLRSIATMLAVENGGFFDMPHVNVRKVSAFRVIPKFGKWAAGSSPPQGQSVGADADGGYIAVDGERMPFEPFQVEIHQGLGTVLSKSGYVYEADGPTNWQSAGGSAAADTVS